jgi:hypothetical protein
VVCLGPRDPVDIAGPRPLSDVGARPLNFTVSVRHLMRHLLSVTFMLCSSAIAQDAHHLLQITVRTDDVTCTLTGKAMPCDEVKTYLIQTLHTALDQPISVSSEGFDHLRERSLAMTLHDAGFTQVVRIGFITEPSGGRH